MSIDSRLREARINAGFSKAAEAADRFGWSKPTYRSHENGNRGVPRSKLVMYAKAFRVSVEWLLTGKGNVNPNSNIKTRKVDSLQSIIEIELLPVLGAVRAGVFVEAIASDNETLMPVVPNPKYTDFRQYLLEVEGSSMNKYYPEGAFIHCVQVEYSEGFTFKHGNHVVVERRRGDLREVTVKEYVLTKDGPELWPRSTDPKFQEPLNITALPDTDEVVITALVIGSYMSRHT